MHMACITHMHTCVCVSLYTYIHTYIHTCMHPTSRNTTQNTAAQTRFRYQLGSPQCGHLPVTPIPCVPHTTRKMAWSGHKDLLTMSSLNAVDFGEFMYAYVCVWPYMYIYIYIYIYMYILWLIHSPRRAWLLLWSKVSFVFPVES
jgi:hypothetical protein